MVREVAPGAASSAVSRGRLRSPTGRWRAEAELSTDLGVDVALPHARAPGPPTPRVEFGRSSEGVATSPPPDEPVRLVFLLVTPIRAARGADRPAGADRQRDQRGVGEERLRRCVVRRRGPRRSARSGWR
ncbi:MAG: PTS sugar transporter subunit IIA [Deltaproteobacteria bacterium]|nr:PTS sugar transporter subunit IIA [Deltaproteobacteria bacterium]